MALTPSPGARIAATGVAGSLRSEPALWPTLMGPRLVSKDCGGPALGIEIGSDRS
jgi:hypothetical protein